ncbi:SDR family oxidoreductase [Pseudoalteromonas sp. S16_S37]|uniref:SDR family oxidoreductase n=1 Tax=Pseudoalteromonas sp. S16_S37 TaxID=2720228 RepID=UPI0016813EC4|nr:SDR family oxidoreductase [Pseudoalteromonas sp. S16_S37]MBD1581228.1 SDR family oxidoreductase [Pseudoalteromonas sp. S16_S37]
MGKVVLITGASRGIGAATAIKLASCGYKVAINFKNNTEAASSVLEKIRRNGGNGALFQADISDEKAVVELFSMVEEKLGAVSHLVNNVGVLQTQMRVEQMSAERINAILMQNVTPYFICAREAIKHFRTHHDTTRCAIVNVSSAASRLGGANEYVDYAASKGAIDSFTTGLSLELAGSGIRVNCVRPGCIYTDIHADGGEPQRVERLASLLPMKRGGTCEEVANAIAWLLSNEASYVTGSFIDLAGGK